MNNSGEGERQKNSIGEVGPETPTDNGKQENKELQVMNEDMKFKPRVNVAYSTFSKERKCKNLFTCSYK